jgi:phage gpG-like protein
MPSFVRITVENEEDVVRALVQIDPKKNPTFVRQALIGGGLLIQKNAALKQIKSGGKGAPLKTKLTSRSGDGRRSIRVDRGGLGRFYVDIGSDLKYMQLHEVGGTVSRRAYTRKSPSGGTHKVRAHTATYPPRPFMKPALNAVNRELRQIFTLGWQKEINKT